MLYLPLVFWTIFCLILPGSLLLYIFKYRSDSNLSFVTDLIHIFPLSFGLSVSLVAVAGWLCYFLDLTFRDVQMIMLVTIASLILVTAILISEHLRKTTNYLNFRSNLGYLLRFTSKNNSIKVSIKSSIIGHLAIWLLAILTMVLSANTGTWLSHTADSFGHISAMRSLIIYDNPLPQEIFFPVPVKEMSPIFGTWNLAMALVADLANSDLLFAWRFFNTILAPFLVLAFASLGFTLTRRLDATLLSTFLFLLLQQKLDLRSLAYPNKAGQILLWMVVVLVLLYANKKSPTHSHLSKSRYLLLIGLLAFGASTLHMQYAPVLMLLLALGLVISFVDKNWDPVYRWAYSIFTNRQAQTTGNNNQPYTTSEEQHRIDARERWSLSIWSSLQGLITWRFLHASIIAIIAALIPFIYKTLQMLSSPKVRITDTTSSDIDSIDFSLWFSSFESMIPLLSVLILGTILIWRRHNYSSAFLIGTGLSVPFFVVVSHVFVGMGGTWNTIIERLVRLVPAILFIWFGWQIVESITLILRNLQARSFTYIYIIPSIVLISSFSFIYQSFEGPKSLYSADSTERFRISVSKHDDLTIRWTDAISALQELPENSVILSDLSTSYMLNGLTGRRVVSLLQQHTSLWDKDTNNIGIFDVLDFMNGRLDPVAEMDALLDNQVSHVFVSKDQTPLIWNHLQTVTALELIDEGEDWRLYSFNPNRVRAYLDFVQQREVLTSTNEIIELYRNAESLFPTIQQYIDTVAMQISIPKDKILPFMKYGDQYQSPLPPNIYYDFLGNLDSSIQSSENNSSYIRRTAFIVDGHPFGVLFQHAPSEAAFTLNIPANSLFSFSPVLAPDVWEYGKGDGVQFTIDLQTEDNKRYMLYDAYLDPKNLVSHRSVVTETVDLSYWAGQAVTITLSTGCGPNDDCSYDWAGWGEPRITQPVSYAFLDHFSEARGEKLDTETGHAEVITQTINYDARPILFQHPSSQVAYSVELPEQASLQFGLGMSPEVWTAERSDGAEYNLYVRTSEGPEVLHQVYQRRIDPKNNPDDRRWFDERIDLSKYGGQQVEIIFEALPGPANNFDFDWGGWSSPILIEEKLSDKK